MEEFYLDNTFMTKSIKAFNSNAKKLLFDKTPFQMHSEVIGTDSMSKLAEDSKLMVKLTEDYRGFVCNGLVPAMINIQNGFNDDAENVSNTLKNTKSLKNDKSKGKAKSSEKSDNSEDIKAFLAKYGIDVNKLETEDGYFIIDKSVGDILKEAGVSQSEIDYTLYDDWYITGLVGKDGTITYSLLKVREPMDSQNHGHGTAVIFKSLDITAIEKVVKDAYKGKKLTSNEINEAQEQLDYITYASRDDWENYSQEMLDYFRDPQSDGSYLIAEFLIDKVAHDKEFNDGKYTLPYSYDDFSSYGQEVLDDLEKKKIYDKEKNTIKIKDPENLTEDEKRAILLITTEDPDVYAFAAENQFHADWYNAYKDVDTMLYSQPLNVYFANYIEKHCIASDTGVGESDAYFSDAYESTFKSESGSYYKEQIDAHGN